jgi:hypothetical protein
VIFSVVYLLIRCLLGCAMVLARREVSRDAELPVLRHENVHLGNPWFTSRMAGRPRQLAAPVLGLPRDDAIGEQLVNTLNHNLIQALLKTATLQALGPQPSRRAGTQ